MLMHLTIAQTQSKNLYILYEAEEEEEEEGRRRRRRMVARVRLKIDRLCGSAESLCTCQGSTKILLAHHKVARLSLTELPRSPVASLSASRAIAESQQDVSALLFKVVTVFEYIAEHLRSHRFSITMSPWVEGQLYMVADSPKTINKNHFQTCALKPAMKQLPLSHALGGLECWLDQSHLLNERWYPTSFCDGEVVGWTNKGESYYDGASY
ncbi:hypothetical protein DFH29DRAFT_881552 [Suillus ampliporus]|nr:hypothetical protein DFH29DRAFT_881552 [Suillus ampliporus]